MYGKIELDKLDVSNQELVEFNDIYDSKNDENPQLIQSLVEKVNNLEDYAFLMENIVDKYIWPKYD